MSATGFALGISASFAANFLSALSGGGSGLFLLPALLLLGLPFQTALATHKIATVGLGVGASIRHGRERLVSARLCLYLLLVGGPGAIIGALVAASIPEAVAQGVLGLLILLLAMMSKRLAKPGMTNAMDASEQKRRGHWIVGSLGVFGIGLLNGSLSSGTGLLLTFWLVSWFGKPLTQALSYTMIVCSLAYNLLGAIVLGLRVPVQWSFALALILGAIAGGYTGSSLSLAKGSAFIQRAFGISCAVIGASLLYGSIQTWQRIV